MKFKDAKVGDKVWHLRLGWGTITKTHLASNYPIKASFNNDTHEPTYTLEGKSDFNDLNPVLFWNEQDLSNDPPPKRKKKVLLRQAVMLSNMEESYFITPNLYKNEKEIAEAYDYGKFIRWGGESIEVEVDGE